MLTPGGQVYTDSRSFDEAPRRALGRRPAGLRHAGGPGLNPDAEPPPPPQLVQAGVRSAECLRAHGLPNVQDPTAQTPYTPGHGFGFTVGEIPPGGKASQAWQHAVQACRSAADAEIRASTLASLGSDG